MKWSKILLFVSITTLVFNNVVSQDLVVKTSIDTSKLLIGQQRNLTLTVQAEKNVKYVFPLLKDSLGKVEILSASAIDTNTSNNRIALTQKYVVTSWDTGFVPFQPVTVSYTKPNDTTHYIAESDPFLLTVNTVTVDTTKAIRDIKPVVDLPWTFADFLPYIIGAVLLIALIIMVVYFIRKNKFKSDEVAPRIPPKPAFDIAMADLQKLKEEKIWQQGNYKLYHTRLTDIIRIYMERRFHFNAMEMITDEILDSEFIKELNSELFSKLKYMLQTADMVKFAKSTPVASENEMCLSNAYDFVLATKPLEVNATQKPNEL